MFGRVFFFLNNSIGKRGYSIIMILGGEPRPIFFLLHVAVKNFPINIEICRKNLIFPDAWNENTNNDVPLQPVYNLMNKFSSRPLLNGK